MVNYGIWTESQPKHFFVKQSKHAKLHFSI